MSIEEDHFERLIEGLCQGDEEIAHGFFHRYDRVLCQIAQRHLTSGIRRRVDADDVVQSVFRTFFRRAQQGQFEFSDGRRLWSLLCAITLTKVREKARYHLRGKRSVQRETAPPPEVDEGLPGRFEAVDREPSPADAAEFTDQFQQLLDALEPEQRQVVELKLQACTQEEIAEQMGISERTVRRILKRVQVRLERLIERGE